jgi:quercetin dioxygenase-like cupin family protein
LIPLPEPFLDGQLSGSIYRFQKAGDNIPMHEHDEATSHVTFVLKGKIVVRGFESAWESSGAAGLLISFEASMPHEIEALEDGTVILNLLKNSRRV